MHPSAQAEGHVGPSPSITAKGCGEAQNVIELMDAVVPRLCQRSAVLVIGGNVNPGPGRIPGREPAVVPARAARTRRERLPLAADTGSGMSPGF